ncbi:MAG: hypothetical protein ACI9J3_000358 [Parvicellaceae bacterium]|jgi:hypothetical protein
MMNKKTLTIIATILLTWTASSQTSDSIIKSSEISIERKQKKVLTENKWEHQMNYYAEADSIVKYSNSTPVSFSNRGEFMFKLPGDDRIWKYRYKLKKESICFRHEKPRKTSIRLDHQYCNKIIRIDNSFLILQSSSNGVLINILYSRTD